MALKPIPPHIILTMHQKVLDLMSFRINAEEGIQQYLKNISKNLE
ncbi:MAG: hypothetical protein QXU95_05485 [Candidatus Bathyarchaeia archaeon]